MAPLRRRGHVSLIAAMISQFVPHAQRIQKVGGGVRGSVTSLHRLQDVQF